MRFLFAISIMLTAAVQALAQEPPRPASIVLPAAASDELLLVRPLRQGTTFVHHNARQLVFTAGANRIAIDFDDRLVGWRHDHSMSSLALLAQSTIRQDGHSLQLACYSITGERRFQVPLAWQRDEPLPELAIHARSGVAIGEPALGVVRLLDGQGREIRELQLFDQRRYELEKVLLLAFLPDGRHVAVAAMANAAAPGMANRRQNAYLLLLTADGRELWRQALPEPSIYNLAVSAGGSFIVVASYDAVSSDTIQRATRAFRLDGQQVLQADHLFRHASFAATSGLAVLSEKSQLWGYDLNAAAPRFRYRAADSARLVVATAVDSSGGHTGVLTAEHIFEDGHFRFVAPRLQVLDADGMPVSDHQVAAPLRAPYLLPAGNRYFAVVTENAIELQPWRAP